MVVLGSLEMLEFLLVAVFCATGGILRSVFVLGLTGTLRVTGDEVGVGRFVTAATCFLKLGEAVVGGFNVVPLPFLLFTIGRFVVA